MKRNSKIELLRILCMAGITMHHLVYHSDIMAQPLGISRLFAQFFIMFGKSGVSIFVLISGYYLAGNAEIDYRRSARRALKTWRRVVFYSVLMLGIALVGFGVPATRRNLTEAAFPILTNHYWFMTAYMGLLILEPFLNRLVHALDAGDFRKLLLALAAMMVLPPSNAWYSHLAWFIALYLAAACMRLHGPRWLTTQKRRLWTAAGCFAFMWLFSVAMSLAATRFPRAGDYVNYLAMRIQNPFMVAGSLALFLYVVNLAPAYHRWINGAAKHMLACYLIQSNNLFYRPLWNFVNGHIPNRGFGYALGVIVSAAVIVAGCMAVDAAFDALGALARRLFARRAAE